MHNGKVNWKRTISIIAQLVQGSRHILHAAVLAFAIGGAVPALAQTSPMGDAAAGDLIEVFPDNRERLIVPCTTEGGALNGCIAEGQEFLSFSQTDGLLFNNGNLEPLEDRSISGMGRVQFLNKVQADDIAVDEVCVAADDRRGNPRDRGKWVCVDILPCTSGNCSRSSTTIAGPVGPDLTFCNDVLQPALDRSHDVEPAAYAVVIDFPRIGETGATAIKTCAGFTHRVAAVRADLDEASLGRLDVYGLHTPGFYCCGGRYIK